MKRKILAFMLILTVISTLGLFASGAKEISSDETVVKVIEISQDENGTYLLRVQKEDGVIIVYRADEENTVCSVPFGQISEGSILAIKDNGIATMSIPAQMWAVEIRDLTLGVNAGAYSFTFADPSDVYAIPPVAEDTIAPSLWEITLDDTVESRFSYAYGYDLVSGYTAQGITFRGSYFARGILDFWNVSEPLIPADEMSGYVDEYIDTIFTPGVEETTGEAPSSLDEIYAITDFDDLSQRFSYAYGYVSAFQDYYYGIMVQPEKFVEGALSAIYGVTPLLDNAERQQAISDYMAQMQAEYEAYISELAQKNLSAAEEFLSENAEAEGVIATESGLQYEIVSEGDGAQPDADDTVTVTYTLRDIDGNLIDQGENVDFALANLIPGFSETVSNMKVGGEAIAYVHPSLGYGESGAGSVEPNSLLIFDIQLHGIVEEE